MPGYTQAKRYYQLAGNVCVYLQAENQLHPFVFLETLQRYVNSLFLVLWACMATFTQYDSINLPDMGLVVKYQ